MQCDIAPPIISLSSAPTGARAQAASGPQLAMGRVVGSLSVLTAKDEDATSAMLASWVSQVGGVGWVTGKQSR